MILLIAVILSFIGGYLIQIYSEKGFDERLYLKEIAPEILFSEKGGIPPHYKSDKGIIAFNTYDITPSIRGYAGPIKLLLALSRDGRIVGLRILEHKETKNYVHFMETPGYLKQFLGKGIHEGFEIDKDIDGISRATVSVNAMAKTIKDSSRIVASNVLGIDVKFEKGRRIVGFEWIAYFLFFFLCLAFYFITRREKRLLWVRDVLLVMGILLIGLYLSSPFSILHIFNLLLLRPSSSPLWYIVVFSSIISIFIAGRFYCGWLCPFGAISELMEGIPLKKWNIPIQLDDSWRNLKYILLGIATIIVFISRRVEFGNYETYVTIFSFYGNILAWLLVIISILANIRIKRFWCRYLCPVGAFTGMFARKDSGYTSSHDCPMSNRTMPLASECIRCNRCYERGK